MQEFLIEVGLCEVLSELNDSDVIRKDETVER